MGGIAELLEGTEDTGDLFDDVSLEGEDLEADVEDTPEEATDAPDPEGTPEGEEETEEAEEAEEDAPAEKADTDKPLFDKKQQAEVNKLIKARLDRQEAKLVKDLTKTAGVEITSKELAPATRLWGLLKHNPELSTQVDAIIAEAISTGKAKAPDADANSVESITQRLELKEAILDMKAADSTFGKNSEKILAWADNEGYDIKDAKTLKLAYLAWKGSQGKVVEAVQQSAAKRKQETKKVLQKRATVQSPKTGAKPTGTADYRKMNEAAVLASEGLSLFTDD